MNRKLLPFVVLVGFFLIAVAVYLALSRNSSTHPTSSESGPILGDAQTGLYYRNPDNSLRERTAYKFPSAEKVYIYLQGQLHPVSTAQAYYRFYGCASNVRIIDCAPVYEMPSRITQDMLQGSPIN